MKNLLKFIFKFILVFSFVIIPIFVSAQGFFGDVCFGRIGLYYFLCRIGGVLNSVLPVLIALGVVYLVFGVVQYFIGDNEEAKTKGKERIIFGIIGLAVIISVWGLVYILTDTLGVGGESAPDLTNLVTTSTASSACSMGTKLQGLLDYVVCIIGKSVVPFIFALAIIMFIWGTIKFLIIDVNEEKKREQGKQFMLWGIIALAVMISIWGLVQILGDTFNIDTTFLPRVQP